MPGGSGTCSRSLSAVIQGQASCLTGWVLTSAIGPPDRLGPQAFPHLHLNRLGGLWWAGLGVQTFGSLRPQWPPNQKEQKGLPCPAPSSYGSYGNGGTNRGACHFSQPLWVSSPSALPSLLSFSSLRTNCEPRKGDGQGLPPLGPLPRTLWERLTGQGLPPLSLL